MKARWIVIVLAILVLPQALGAQGIVWRLAPSSVPDLRQAVVPPVKALTTGVPALQKWLFPFFKVSPSAPAGDRFNTFIALRNPTGNPVTVTVRYYGANGGSPLLTTSMTLTSKQVFTKSLQDYSQLTNHEGYAIIESRLPGLLADSVRIETTVPYAVVGQAISWSDLCQVWHTRFLNGALGGVGGPVVSTRFRLWFERPLGDDTALPPSLAANVYDESGKLLGTVFGWTSNQVEDVTMGQLFEELQALGVTAKSDFGALEVAFLAGKGAVLTDASSASGLRGILPAQCLVR